MVFEIFKQAFPASMNMLLIGIGFFIIQKYVTGYGANASAGYGIALRIEQIILLPAIGLNTAVLSMTGQNFGAKNFDRIYEAFVTSLKLALLLMVFGSAILFLVGEQMAFLFTRDTEVITNCRKLFIHGCFFNLCLSSDPSKWFSSIGDEKTNN